jgi:hypothetical protein
VRGRKGHPKRFKPTTKAQESTKFSEYETKLKKQNAFAQLLR